MLNSPVAVLMAKKPSPGNVKTRLITNHQINANNAADIAKAMMFCIAARLSSIFPDNLILAVSPDNAGDMGLGNFCSHVINQGEGNLGDRLNHVWLQINKLRQSDGPITFWGIDSPDIPKQQITLLKDLLLGAQSGDKPNSIDQQHTNINRCPDIILGPTPDGGFWTLGAVSYQPAILGNISWGGNNVCAQTELNAQSANLKIAKLEMWPDVDDINDLNTMLDRIKNATDPHMLRLYRSIKNIYSKC